MKSRRALATCLIVLSVGWACAPDAEKKPDASTSKSQAPERKPETKEAPLPEKTPDPPVETEQPPAVTGPDAIKVQHLLIAFRDAAGFAGSAPEAARERSEREARELALALLDRVRGGEDFDALIEQYTDDSSPGIYGMTNTGAPSRPGYQTRGGMVAAFGDIGFELEVGEVGLAEYDPATSKFGFHIIKRIE